MSILRKPYEISLWYDSQDPISHEPIETKIVTFGSDTMTSESRAVDPKLTCDINGTHQFTFKLYYQYKDTQTGETIRNRFADLLTNESKIKLKYDDKWYDFVIKNIVENSSDYSYSYTATDLFINELSKTGYNLEFSDDLMNNMGTVKKLCEDVLDGSGWSVVSETIVQKQKEALFACTVSTGFPAVVLGWNATNGVQTVSTTSIPANATIYVFYSCLANKTARLQFLYLDGATPVLDSERIITNGIQCYYYEDAEYGTLNTNYGVYTVTTPSLATNFTLSDYRGERYVFSQESHIDKKLNKVVYEYTRNGEEYLGYTTTTYESPSLLQDYVSNSHDFMSDKGWTGSAIVSSGTATAEQSGKVTYQTDPNFIDKINHGQEIGDTYIPELLVNLPNEGGATITPALINTGFYDNILRLKQLDKGEKFVLYYKIIQEDSTDLYSFSDLGITPYITDALYDAGKNGYSSGTMTYLTFDTTNINDMSLGDHYYRLGTVSSSLSYEELKNTHLVLVIAAKNKTFRIRDLRIFRYIDSGNGTPILPDSQQVEAKIHTVYNYFKADAVYTSAEDLPVESYDASQNVFVPKIRNNCEKVRSINISKSNRFNIIQSLCETFECWASFDIAHDEIGTTTGKTVTIHNYIGQDNPVDFKYGINIKTISRTLDSKPLVSKLIVSPNSNEFGKNKFCTIARAHNNPTGDTAIYNFDYYVNKGMIDAAQLDNDLYKRPDDFSWDNPDFSNNTLGYYSFLNEINARLRALSEEVSSLAVAMPQTAAVIEKNEAQKREATIGIEDINEKLEKYYDVTYNALVNYDPSITPRDPKLENAYDHLRRENNDTYTFSNLNFILENSSTHTYKISFKYTPNATGTYSSGINSFRVWCGTKDKDITTIVEQELAQYREAGKDYTFSTSQSFNEALDTSANKSFYINANFTNQVICTAMMPQDRQLVQWITAGTEYSSAQSEAEAALIIAREQYQAYEDRLAAIEAEQETLINRKKILDTEFFRRYSRFIQEGTWIDEKYNDDELYYFDAQSVGYESSVPKVTYQLSVLDISQLEGYEAFTFKLGDRTYIEDPEFFGYTTVNGLQTPAREQVTVNKVLYALDDPAGNTITIQTYKSLFQDLFQRITATVQQVSYATGSYERAAALAEASTARKVQFLQDALNDAATVLTNMAEQSVVWDTTGITVTNTANPSEKLRIVSGGILLGKQNAQGEDTWVTAITANGVSASVLTSGILNTGVIQIMSGTEPTFRWDVYGLTAYDFTMPDSLGTIVDINVTKGVRFDRFGIYGFSEIDGSAWHPNKIVQWGDDGQAARDDESIRTHSFFELTKEGLHLQMGGLTYGHYSGGINLYSKFDSPKSHTVTAWLGKGDDLLYNTWSIINGKKVYPYYNTLATTLEFVKIFSVKNDTTEKLAIYDDGTFIAQDAIISGNITATSGTFTGTIEAQSGHIGGFTITSNTLYAGSGSNYVGLSSGNTMIFAGATDQYGTGAKFYVTNAGKLTATGVDIAGKLNVALTHYHEYAELGMWKVGNPLGNNESSTLDNRGSFDRYFFTEAVRNGATYIMGMQNPADEGSVAFTIGATQWDPWSSSKFYVDYYGKLTCEDAQINGATLANITVENIATIGSIQGYQIESYSDSPAQLFNLKVTAGKTQSQRSISFKYKANQAGFSSGDMNVYIKLVYTEDDHPAYEWITVVIPDGTYFSTSDQLFITQCPVSATTALFTSYYFTNSSHTTETTTLNFTAQYEQGSQQKSTIFCKSQLLPLDDATYLLGDSAHRWQNVYSLNSLCQTSDRREKQNVSLLSSSYDSFFDALRPSTYQWLNESITHTGFIAQEVEEALTAAHLTPKDFYGYRNEDPDHLGLAYSEFISLNTWQIQKLKKRVAELERKIESLTNS